jgi:hypothetical protein
MPRRLDIVRLRVGEYELEVRFTVALEGWASVPE